MERQGLRLRGWSYSMFVVVGQLLGSLSAMTACTELLYKVTFKSHLRTLRNTCEAHRDMS